MDDPETQDMPRGRRELVKELFHQALEQPSEARAAFLNKACHQREDLREEVDALLFAHEEAAKFLAEPLERGALTEGPGTVIDRYKLLQEIGEGGFGVVWMAEQVEPVRRRVALKIIKLGMNTKQVVARFDAERQALAMMDHPNIARVLDGGTTDLGRPYFAMELVRGEPITYFCDKAKLRLQDRLRLFQQVCHAVQHAHQKGVIHRDLKPSNILVTLHDDVPVPKVIDFGVAKATCQELTQKTLFTELQQIIGTPEYMAPEQSELSGLDVDTRADIYGLGVVLYELLTGTRPFELSSMKGKGYIEMLRHIREVEPPRPSSRLAMLGAQLPVVAARCESEPHKLHGLLRGDLDWIVMKALEKDRSRRYATASALADDISRHLEDRPVEAGRPGVVYRLTKLIRRNKVTVAAATLIVAIGLVGIAGIAISLNRASLQAKRAENVIQLIHDMLGSADPHESRGPDFTVLELLDEFDARLGERLPQDPEIEADIRSTMGLAYRNLGMVEKSEAHVVAAMRIRKEELGETDALYGDSLSDWAWTLHEKGDYRAAQEAMEHALEISRTSDPGTRGGMLYGLADFLRHNGSYEEAEQRGRESVQILREMQRPDLLAPSLNILGLTLQDLGRFADAEVIFREVLEIRRGQYGAEHLHVASALNSLGSILNRLGRYGDSEESHREALGMRRKFLDDRHVLIGISLNNLAAVLATQSSHEEALPHFREALELFRNSFGEDHVYVAHTMRNVAKSLSLLGEHAEAEQLHRDALARFIEIFSPEHLQVARSMEELAKSLGIHGDHEEAEGMFRSALSVYRKILGETHPDVSRAITSLADSLAAQGHHTDAEELYREAIAGVTELGVAHPLTLRALGGLSESIQSQGRHGEAEQVLLEAYQKLEDESHPRRTFVIERLINLYQNWDAADGGKADRVSFWQAELSRVQAEVRSRADGIR